MELEEQLKNKIKNIENMEYPDEEKYCFFTKIASEMTRNPDFSTIKDSEMIIAFLSITNPKYSFQQIIQTITEVEECLDESSCHDIGIWLSAVYVLRTVNLLENVIQFKEKPKKDELKKIIDKYDPQINGEISQKKDNKLILMGSLSYYIKTGLKIFGDFEFVQKVATLLQCFDNIDVYYDKYVSYKKGHNFLSIIKGIEKNKNLKEDFFDFVGDKNLEERYPMLLEIMDIENKLSEIKNYDAKLAKQKSIFTKKKNKMIVCYNELLQIISQNNNKVIEIPYDLLEKTEDEELINTFIKNALEHNRSLYSQLVIENIKKDNYNMVEQLFYKYNINFNEFTLEQRQKITKYVNIDKMDMTLCCLEGNNWNWLNISNPIYIDVLLNTKFEIIKYIDELIKQSKIDVNFVISNPEILFENNVENVDNNKQYIGKYQLFKNNMIIVERNMFNPYPISKNNGELLLMPPELLLSMIDLMHQYHLELNNERLKTYAFDILNHPEYLDDLDTFIELGYKDIIIENPYLLCQKSKEILTRLTITQNIGLDVVNKDNQFHSNITTGKGFYVANEQLKDYQTYTTEKYIKDSNFIILKELQRTKISEDTKLLGIVEFLDQHFKVSELEYQFEDTIISRMKVLRNIETILNYSNEINEVEAAFSSIIYGSVMDDYTIEFIRSKLSEYKIKGTKKKTYNI